MKYNNGFYNQTIPKLRDEAPPQRIEAGEISNETFCLTCRKSVGLIDFEESVRHFRRSESELKSLIYSRRIHPLRNLRGVLMFCRNSVEQAFREQTAARQVDADIFATNPAPENFDIHQTQPN